MSSLNVVFILLGSFRKFNNLFCLKDLVTLFYIFWSSRWIPSNAMAGNKDSMVIAFDNRIRIFVAVVPAKCILFFYFFLSYFALWFYFFLLVFSDEFL